MIDDHLIGVFSEFEGGTAFNRGLETDISGLQTKFGGIGDRIPQNLDLLADQFASKVSTIGSRYTASAQRLEGFAAHVSDHFDHIADNMSLFSSSQQLENSLSNAKENSCGDMHSIFGSITQEGPSAIKSMSANIDLALRTFDEVKTTYTELQQEVASVRTGLLANLNQQIALEVSDAKRLVMVDLKGQLENQFNTAKRQIRDDLVASVIAQTTDVRNQAASTLRDGLRMRDDAVEGVVSTMDRYASEMSAQETTLGNLITNEKAKILAATKRLTQFASAANIRSLVNSDPCVQTLMGYVGSDSLLRKLG